MNAWQASLRADPLPWLLHQAGPAVRARALVDLVGRSRDDPEVTEARDAAMRRDPIASILAAQDRAGWWVKPGPGYAPKYRGTVWSVMLLAQLGADPTDPRVRAACDHVLSFTATRTGGFGMSGEARAAPPGPASVLHCLNGNLLAALIGLGHLDAPEVARAVEWQVAAITGEGHRPTAYVPGPGFRCGANDGLPCEWGAVKAVQGLAAIPVDRRSEEVRAALRAGVDLLSARAPVIADHPTGGFPIRPNRSWYRLGFPQFYIADVLGALEALCAAGAAANPGLDHAVTWLLALQDRDGRWANQNPYAGRLWGDIEAPGGPSPWVTLRACRVLRSVAIARKASGP